LPVGVREVVISVVAVVAQEVIGHPQGLQEVAHLPSLL